MLPFGENVPIEFNRPGSIGVVAHFGVPLLELPHFLVGSSTDDVLGVVRLQQFAAVVEDIRMIVEGQIVQYLTNASTPPSPVVLLEADVPENVVDFLQIPLFLLATPH